MIRHFKFRKVVRFCRGTVGLAVLALALALPLPLPLPALALAQSTEVPFAGSGQLPQFTSQQAMRGEQAYAQSCAACHGAQLQGTSAGPALNDATFKTTWHSIRPGSLYAYVTAQMPPTAPGSLSSDTYADLATYLFEANGFASGSAAFVPSASSSPAARIPTKHDAVSDAVEAQRRSELEHLTPITDQMLRAPPSSDWLIWHGTYAARSYSPLRQIDRSNAERLQLAWAWSLQPSANEITPLEHDGVIFVKSANTVEALDAVSGQMLWRYLRPYPEWMHDGRMEQVRSISLYQNMLYAPFLDGHFVALDIHSGKVLWDHVLVGPAEAASRLPGARDNADNPQLYLMDADGGSIVADGEVIVGLSGCINDYKGGCFIVGLNAESGHEDWRFNTIARPGQPGGDSWNGAPVDQRFGASAWIPGTYNPQTDLVYFGTGQTYRIAELLTPGRDGPYGGPSTAALYTDTTVALNPRTGKLVWYYQHFPGDVWDLDWAFEQTLVTLPEHGRNEPLVVTAGKIGIFDAIDAATGHYVFSRDLGVQNLVTAIDPATGEKSIDMSMIPPVSGARPRHLNCGAARDEPSTAYDPVSHLMYVPFIDDSCVDPRELNDTVRGSRLVGRPFDGKYGRLEAFNLETGKLAWMKRQRAPEISSVLVTAGGVVFDSTLDRVFRASDAATGRTLWQTRLDNTPKSSPIAFSVKGRQYVAVVAGGQFEISAGNGNVPELAEPGPATTLWVFSLPAPNQPNGRQ